MTDITVRFNLSFSRRFITLAGAGVIMLCAVPELDSESVTLSTYYPAPSGVYANMITTGNTFLARDAGVGVVGIGTTAPGATKLYVRDNDNDATANIAQFFALNLTQGIGVGYNRIQAVGSNPNQDVLILPKGTGRVGVGTTAPAATVGIAGDLSTTGAVKITAGAGCSAPQMHMYSSPAGGSTALCVGQYVTTVAGLYTKYIALPLDRGAVTSPSVNNQFTYVCCPCPPAGCNGM